MTMKRYTYILYILATFLLCACANDEEVDENGYGSNVQVKVNLSTRATGVPEGTTIGNELINDWWVIFVEDKAGGKIVKYIDRAMAKGSVSTAVESEDFLLEIPTGNYVAYSFANITKADVEAVCGALNVGSTMPDLSSVNFNIVSVIPNGTAEGATAIPMTGRQNVRFASAGMQLVELEVVRMVSKLEFQFKNRSRRKLTVNSLTINSMQTDDVPLLPDYGKLDDGWTFPTSAYGTKKALTRTYAGLTAISLNAYSGSGDPASSNDKFYMQESTAIQTESKRYLLAVNVTREGGSAENLYFMLDKTTTETIPLQTIYRNDHLVVPLVITDYTVELDVNFYPPIGGYPAVVTEDKDKDEFYCTFRTQGEFEIMPRVYNTNTGSVVYYPQWDYSSMTVAYSDPDGLFKTSKGGKAPYIDTTTRELLGKLSTNQGTAVVDIEIKVAATGQIYKRRIYIIRKD